MMNRHIWSIPRPGWARRETSGLRVISALSAVCFIFCSQTALAGKKVKQDTLQRYDSHTNITMKGYQGWFNTPTDGANQKWRHYGNGKDFKPGKCTIDFWPDMREYDKRYKTPFKFPDGSTAYVFSSYDVSTVDLHFKWMKDYGIDGAFMQRFIHSIHKDTIRGHCNKVFDSAVHASKNYGRALSIRYDLTDMDKDGPHALLNDLDSLNAKYSFFDRRKFPTFLYHRKKPLIAIGGIGFTEDKIDGDDIGYLKSAVTLITSLKKRGYSVMMRVPAKWRDFAGNSIISKPEDKKQFHEIIKSVDILMPWLVGAFHEDTYVARKWKKRIAADMAWCKVYNVDYVPVACCGFSRYNLRWGDTSSFRPSNRGSFFWLQVKTAINLGAERLFLAQFDEMDEGTQFFKVRTKTTSWGGPVYCLRRRYRKRPLPVACRKCPTNAPGRNTIHSYGPPSGAAEQRSNQDRNYSGEIDTEIRMNTRQLAS